MAVKRATGQGPINLAERTEETWRPPLFAPPAAGGGAALRDAVRRLLDLQAGSIWRDLARELPPVRGCVLDVGCGAQPYRGLFARGGVTYTGLDTAEAKAHFGYEVPDTRYFSGTTWPAESGSADFVLATEALEHVREPRAFLAEAYRCLRPRGRLLLTVPFAARWHFVPHDYWRFTPSGLRYLLEETGFIGVVVTGRGNALTVACYKTMALFLPLLLPQGRRPLAAGLGLAAGLVGLPLLLVLAAVANLSLRFPAGEDCLGFTVRAVRP
jgi:SAM-dependent methyltransferase